jgi:DNA repair exonuclease SbcCD ATPase subunit
MFVEFEKIEFQNYKSIKKGSLILKDRGVVLIQGINNDKGGSNGAGKSSLETGILWCLFGKTLVGKETEKEIIPKFIQKKEFIATGGCCVSTYLKRDSVPYIISRYLKSPEFKNASVVKRVEENGSLTDLSKCIDKETDALIVEIVGADYQAFIHSNVFSFSNIEPFLMRGDKEKKELILPKYFVDMFKLAYKKCSEEIKDVEESLKKINENILALTVLESEKGIVFNEVIGEIKERDKELAEVKKRISEEEGKKTSIEKTVSEYNIVLKIHDKKLEGLLLEKKDSETEYTKWYNKNSELTLLENKVTTIERDISKKRLELEEYRRNDNKAAVRKLAELSETATIKEKQYIDWEKKKSACKEVLKEKGKLLQEVQDTKNSIKVKIQLLDKELVAVSQNIAVLSSSVGQKNNRSDEIKKSYYSEECKSCPHNKLNKLLETIAEEVRETKESLNPCERKKEELEEDIKILSVNAAAAIELEESCAKQIRTVEEEELQPILQEIGIVSRALHDLKNTLQEVQYTVDNAGEVLKTIANIDSTIKQLNSELIKTKDRIQKLKKDKPTIQMHKYDSLKNDVVERITSENKAKEEAKTGLNAVKVNLSTLKERIRGMKESLNVGDALEKKKERIEGDIKVAKGKKNGLIFDQKRGNNKLEFLNFWKVGFSPAGIEGFMMDSLVNAMNSLIAKYLGYLSSNTIALTLIPDKKLKSGDTRNKLSEKVDNDFGGETYRTNSEGEKRIMDIAILFALKYIYEQMTGTKYNILFMDEAFDTLDAHTCSLVINLINTLEEITSILVVSHIDAICLEFDSFIKMIKTKRVTEIIDENNSD